VADESVFDEVVELARDARYSVGERGVLVLALANMRERREGAIEVLRELLSDDVALRAVTALGELRAGEARAEIEPFLEHPDPSVRKEAGKAIKRIDKE
jgi:HEAT repeat protein